MSIADPRRRVVSPNALLGQAMRMTAGDASFRRSLRPETRRLC
jgi:hypothetical protein